jgi:outer membrane receptor protein involved in Fe transport
MIKPKRVVCAALLLMAVVYAPAPARAGDVADEAQFHFARGTQFYRQARFDDALAEFYASNRLVPNRNVQFNIARSLEQLHLYDEAFRAWSELLRGSPPAAERAAIEGAIDKLRPHLALLLVTTTPPGAEIYANRRDLGSLGVTPKLLALPPGHLKVLLDLPGYRSVELPVDVAKGSEQKLAPSLERIVGGVEFRQLPAGAVVREGTIDGRVLMQGPGSARLVPGRHVLFVSAPGYVTARVEVDVEPDGTTSVDVPLAPAASPTGAVVVRANIDGALVRIDGREMGFSPAVIEGVPVGERFIEVVKEGRQTYRTHVVVRQSERAYLDVRLRRERPEISAATKRLTRAEEAPASITVITAEEIRAFGYLTLSEALSGIRGVVSSNDRTYEAIGFRGLSPPGDYTKRVLVLVDGHPYNDIVVGQGYVGHDLDVDLENVERIEVVRGPGSVLYGTGALFGVINVVTRRPQPGEHAEGSTAVGTLGMREGRVTASARGDRAELMASGALFSQQGDRLFNWNDGSIAAFADGETARHADLAGRLGPVTLRAAFNDRIKTVPTGVFDTLAAPGTTYRDERAFAELRIDQPLGASRLSARAAYDLGLFHGNYRLQTTMATDPPLANDDFRSQAATGELRLELPAFRSHHFTLGAEAQDQFQIRQRSSSTAPNGRVSGYLASDVHELILSSYLVDDWTPVRRARLNLGVRADDYTKSFGWTVNPRGALIVQPYDGGNTKVLLGSAFRAPSAYERFYNDGGITQIAPGSLSPETIWSLEVEHTHAVDDDLQVVVAGFGHRLDNLIVLNTVDPTSGVRVFQNEANRVWGYGAEGEVRWQPDVGALFVFAYAWQRTRLYAPDGTTPLPNAPDYQASLRVFYPLLGAALRIGNEMIFDMQRHLANGDVTPNALTWNVSLSGEYRRFRLRYFGGVFNLLDDRTGYPVGGEVPAGLTVPRYGRTVRAGLAFTF